MQTGMVFDIQRFSIHDGPGIRTSVFLKGCPLRCFWCHNPEGLACGVELQFYPEHCLGCGACLTVCDAGAQQNCSDGHRLDRDTCVVCGTCARECFSGALTLVGRRITTAQVLNDVLADRPFYGETGGMTLTGGEPFLQPEFSHELLARAREHGIRTAVETCGCYPWARIEPSLPLIDLVMLDIKTMDGAVHRRVTGVSNEAILRTATGLAGTDIPLLIRTPVIPGVNDSDASIRDIAGFVQELQHVRRRMDAGRRSTSTRGPAHPAGVRFELLAFHTMGEHKYRSLGMSSGAEGLAPPSPETMERLSQAAGLAGEHSRDSG